MALKRVFSLNARLTHAMGQSASVCRFGSAGAVSSEEPTTFATRYADRCKVTGKVRLVVGDFALAHKKFTAADVQTYAEITGDDNPVHSIESDDAAQEQGFSASICHGMFSGALFSAAVGGGFPGSILVEKTLKWKKPLYMDEELSARVEIKKVLNRRKLVLCNMTAKNQDDEVVVLVPAKMHLKMSLTSIPNYSWTK